MEGDLRRLLSDTQASLVLDSDAPILRMASPAPALAATRPWRAGASELRLIQSQVLAKVAPDQDFGPGVGSGASLARQRPVLTLLESPVDEPLPVPIPHSRAKRCLDVTVALGLLILLVPLLFFVGLLVALDRRGPILFLQRRCGLGGSVFRICKFRTMTVCEDGDDVAQTAPGDRRITPLGAFLRRTSIDELPQLFNVLLGDMSLVGPRPHAAAHDRAFIAALPDYAARYRVRPGITGLAQLRGLRGAIRDHDQLARRVEADIEYIERWSVLADLRILVASVGIVFRADGA